MKAPVMTAVSKEVFVGQRVHERSIRKAVEMERNWTFDRKGLIEAVRELSRLQAWKSLLAIALDWGLVVACFVTAVSFPHPVVWLWAALVIATRQHGLLILMHEASHYRILSNRKWNDRMSNWLMAYPLLITTEGYRSHHAAHHDHLNTDGDPDWVRKRDQESWVFPKTMKGLVGILVRDFCGGGLMDNIRLMRIFTKAARGKNKKKKSSWPWGRVLFYVFLISVAIATDLWLPILVLWYLPAFTILAVILRLRSISEHFGLESTHELNSSRNVKATYMERFFLVPHNIGYHLDHHLFPSVPFYNIHALHERLMADPLYAAHAHQTCTVSGLQPGSLLMELTADMGEVNPTIQPSNVRNRKIHVT